MIQCLHFSQLCSFNIINDENIRNIIIIHTIPDKEDKDVKSIDFIPGCLIYLPLK